MYILLYILYKVQVITILYKRLPSSNNKIEYYHLYNATNMHFYLHNQLIMVNIIKISCPFTSHGQNFETQQYRYTYAWRSSDYRL